MAQDKTDVSKQLTELWERNDIPILETAGKRYALMSDIHLGDGGDADDFTENEPALLKALDYYRENGYTLLLLGDTEEFWQFDLDSINNRYKETVYSRMKGFGRDRVIRIFGNHDYEWGGFIDPISEAELSHVAYEAVKLADHAGVACIMLVHGHQGTIESDKYSWFSRFWVRLFSLVEPLARSTRLYVNPTVTKSQIAKDYERTLYQWAKEKKVMLICGHSHRAIFASKSRAEKVNERISKLEAENSKRTTSSAQIRKNLQEIRELNNELNDEKSKGRIIEATDPGQEPLPCYFNTGCGIYSDGLTALEIGDDKMRLVKWSRGPTPKTSIHPPYGEGKLSEFLQEINKRQENSEG